MLGNEKICVLHASRFLSLACQTWSQVYFSGWVECIHWCIKLSAKFPMLTELCNQHLSDAETRFTKGYILCFFLRLNFVRFRIIPCEAAIMEVLNWRKCSWELLEEEYCAKKGEYFGPLSKRVFSHNSQKLDMSETGERGGILKTGKFPWLHSFTQPPLSSN